MIKYKKLYIDDIGDDLFDGFIRHQIVTKCWRQENGHWVIKEDPFIDDWSEKDRQIVLIHLRKLLLSDGLVYAAFYEEKMKGFIAVDATLFGSCQEYMDLTDLYISEDMRRKGIGKALFLVAADWAKKKGAKKLYISAHSAIESQAFYRSMGCIEAKIYDQRHVEKEPYDCQLEYKL